MTHSPFDLVVDQQVPRTASKLELVQRVRALERVALEDPEITAAAVCLQDGRFLTRATREVYAELARRGAHVRILGREVHAAIAPGVVGVDLSDDDPLGDEWTVVLVGPAPVCLAARDLHVASPDDATRSFTWVQTTDADLVGQVHARLVEHAPSGRP